MMLSRRFASLILTLFALLGWTDLARAQWTALNNAPPGTLDTCLLLTDGRVFCHEYSSNAWFLLTPDIDGSYANGTWSLSATMPDGTDSTNACTPSCPYTPLYFGSAVLADGSVVVVGGEYLGAGMVWSPIGFIYDPVTDSWSSQLVIPFVSPPGSTTGCVGDVQIIVLDDGTMLMASVRSAGGACNNQDLAALDVPTLTFTALGPAGKACSNQEENWNILPDGRVLTVDAHIQTQFEIYDSATNTWTSGSTVVNLADTGPGSGGSTEVGPGIMRPDGTLIYFSGNNLGQNAVYDTATGMFTNTAAMDFPVILGAQYSVADGPASLLPNGNVLVMSSPTAIGSTFQSPSHFFEWDGTNLTQVADSPNAASFNSYQGRMVLLPTGEVFLTAFDQGAITDVQLYSNGGAPQDEWRPVITLATAEVLPGTTYSITGRLFNGFSEGASYGDDAASSTNYPLVRITNDASGHVFYARTHDHSRMGIDLIDSTETTTTLFEAPFTLEVGPSELVVVVNGIESDPIHINCPGAPVLTVPGPVVFDTICLDGSSIETLLVCNTGGSDCGNLVIDGISSSDPQFVVTVPSSGYPLEVSSDFCFPFQVVFTPDGLGPTVAFLTIESNDAAVPELMIMVSSDVGEPDIETAIADSGSFGDVCLGDFHDLDLVINNSGLCDLSLNGISSNSGEFLTASVMSYPLVIGHGDILRIPIRFEPTGGFGPRSAMLTIASNDPDSPNVFVAVSGNVPPGDIEVTGSTEFGDVCPGVLAEKTFSVCNVGLCTLNVTGASVDCADFTIVSNPFPAPVSHDFCLDLVVRFTPTSVGEKSCDLTITSDDPDEPSLVLTLTGNTPIPMIDVPPDQAFPPTVIQATAPCTSQNPFPISNTGTCNLIITNVSITSNAAEYSLSGLPSYPIILPPGGIVGQGDLRINFAPFVMDRDRIGEISVTYISEPITGDTTTVTRVLCGEGVDTGARVLVTNAGVPMAHVRSIKLRRINANFNQPGVDTNDNAMNLALQTVVPALPCQPFQYHREYGTVSNRSMLIPGSYIVTVRVRIDNHNFSQAFSFSVDSCGFNPTIVIDFP